MVLLAEGFDSGGDCSGPAPPFKLNVQFRVELQIYLPYSPTTPTKIRTSNGSLSDPLVFTRSMNAFEYFEFTPSEAVTDLLGFAPNTMYSWPFFGSDAKLLLRVISFCSNQGRQRPSRLASWLVWSIKPRFLCAHLGPRHRSMYSHEDRLWRSSRAQKDKQKPPLPQPWLQLTLWLHSLTIGLSAPPCYHYGL